MWGEPPAAERITRKHACAAAEEMSCEAAGRQRKRDCDAIGKPLSFLVAKLEGIGPAACGMPRARRPAIRPDMIDELLRRTARRRCLGGKGRAGSWRNPMAISAES